MDPPGADAPGPRGNGSTTTTATDPTRNTTPPSPTASTTTTTTHIQPPPPAASEKALHVSRSTSSTASATPDIDKTHTGDIESGNTQNGGDDNKKKRSWNPLRWREIPPIPDKPQMSKEASAGVLSNLTFHWIGDFMKVGYLRPLHENDLPNVPPARKAHALSSRLHASFTRRLARGDRHPLFWALNETFFFDFWLAGGCRLLTDLFLVMTPLALKYLIRFAAEAYAAQHTPGAAQPSVGRGVGLAVGIAAMQMCASFAMGQFLYRGMVTGGQARAALIGAIFDKSLRISPRARAGGGGDGTAGAEAATGTQKKKGKKGRDSDQPPAEGWTNGHITNLMSTDSHRVDSVCAWFHIIWTSPVTIILTLVLLLINISYSALAGYALLLLGFPAIGSLIRVLTAKRRLVNKITDRRVGLTQEILMGARFVKYYAWEESFLRQLKRLRADEVRAVQFLLGLRSGVIAAGMSLPVFAAMLAFITYSLKGNGLSPDAIFSSLALFNALRMPLNMLPVVISQAVDAWVSIKRIEAFLKAEEIQGHREVTNAEKMGDGTAIEIVGGGFTWEKASAAEDEQKGGRKRGAEAPLLREEIKEAKRREKEEEKAGSAQRTAKNTTTSGTPAEEAPPFQLKDVNLSFARDELVAIVGSVGSGKTSLLAAIAGEMRQTDGTIRQSARLAYCPQSAWIQNASVRDNIVFGKPLDAEWYQRVIYACALQPDLDMLPDGDATEIGERGITISGGQKQRVNIARAIYFDAEIVLMDDPLSAVDAHVGRHLFDEAICGLLRGKCRVLATHQLHVLERCDRVMWIEDGNVKAVGTYAELMGAEEGFRTLVGEYGKKYEEEQRRKAEAAASKPALDDDDDDDDDDESPSESGQDDTTAPAGAMDEIRKIESHKKKPKEAHPAVPTKPLMQTEERATSSVGWDVYKAYIRASGTYLSAPGIVGMLILSQGANIMMTLWLSYWTSDEFGLPNGTYIGVFAALGVAQSVLMFLFAFWLTIAGTTSSKVLMGRAMERVLRAPMSFFDTTPIGRIVNRFSKDVDVMDNNLTDAIRMYFFTLVMVFSVFILIIVYFYYFVIALVPLTILFLFAASYYRSSAREVKRHESVLRSVVYAKFGEALTGIATIRAYGLQEHFMSELYQSIDRMDAAYFITFANQRWLSLRLDIIGNLLVFTTGILVVTSRFSVSPSIAGVVLSYILQIVMMIQWMIRQLAEVENAMNSTERIHYYGTSLPSEAALHTNAAVHLPPSWPSAGAIEFRDVEMRYRPGLPLVLQGVNLDIKGGERIGIVGRTGAGKSSVMSALFRLVELENGSIWIDGVDIKTLGLHDLRSKLAIIPQDPTLFRGTVRSNLDPFDQHTDEELWAALRRSYLVDDHGPEDSDGKITLSTPVLDAGENFSLGQRQLMALARALVRNSRIIVCDEATSSVDHETDRKIQRTMREGFKGRTVLCIAHRLGTVVGYDRVVVMEKGAVVEVGSPRELWERGGRWRGMCERGGIKEEDFEAAEREEE
ncbi:ABC multidrug transporter [Kalaharituber pfeilii]|nr:ABC multidrug transporter [Kalaharituber pfeilii]